MNIIAKSKYVHMAPRKIRLIANLLRGLDVVAAKRQLTLSPKRAVEPMTKLLDSAVANAVHNYNLSEDNLYISEVRVDGGAIMYRWMPRAMGRATPLRKRTSMLVMILSERVPVDEVKKVKNPKASVITVKAKKGDQPVEKVPQETKEKDASVKVHTTKKGGFQNTDDLEKKTKKDKGFLKKVFNRKSGM